MRKRNIKQIKIKKLIEMIQKESGKRVYLKETPDNIERKKIQNRILEFDKFLDEVHDVFCNDEDRLKWENKGDDAWFIVDLSFALTETQDTLKTINRLINIICEKDQHE